MTTDYRPPLGEILALRQHAHAHLWDTCLLLGASTGDEDEYGLPQVTYTALPNPDRDDARWDCNVAAHYEYRQGEGRVRTDLTLVRLPNSVVALDVRRIHVLTLASGTLAVDWMLDVEGLPVLGLTTAVYHCRTAWENT